MHGQAYPEVGLMAPDVRTNCTGQTSVLWADFVLTAAGCLCFLGICQICGSVGKGNSGGVYTSIRIGLRISVWISVRRLAGRNQSIAVGSRWNRKMCFKAFRAKTDTSPKLRVVSKYMNG